MSSRWIETSTRSGPTVERYGFSVTPQSWSLTAAWPGGGWVWNHPRAILVSREGTQERIPIYNLTLLVQLALAALAAVFALLIFIPSVNRSRHRRE